MTRHQTEAGVGSSPSPWRLENLPQEIDRETAPLRTDGGGVCPKHALGYLFMVTSFDEDEVQRLHPGLWDFAHDQFAAAMGWRDTDHA